MNKKVKKKLLRIFFIIFLLFFLLPTTGMTRTRKPLCLDLFLNFFIPSPIKKKLGRGAEGDLSSWTTGGATTLPISLLFSTFFDHTTITSTRCMPIWKVYAEITQNEKEQLIFMALNYNPVIDETTQRSGEFVSIALNAMGCAKRPKIFYDELAENFEDIFRKKEYGLAYAIRINRILTRDKICTQNGVRYFLRTLDEYYSQEYLNFPQLSQKAIRQNQNNLQKITKEYH